MRALVPVLLCSLIVASCGGGGGDESTSTHATIEPTTQSSSTTTTKSEPTPASGPTDRAEISKNAATVVGGGDPSAVCHGLVTAHYVSSAYGDEQGCAAAQDPSGFAEVRVGKIAVSGDRATALAIPTSGSSAGDHIRVELVHDGGTWKVDSVKSNAPVGP
jgi:hypothetical protein